MDAAVGFTQERGSPKPWALSIMGLHLPLVWDRMRGEPGRCWWLQLQVAAHQKAASRLSSLLFALNLFSFHCVACEGLCLPRVCGFGCLPFCALC